MEHIGIIWHFDNCKKNPQCKRSKNEKTCPHCGKDKLTAGNATRWHFDNCPKST